MTVHGNAGKVEIVKDLVLLTGIVSAKVLAINPTLQELNDDLGFNFEKEVNYTDETLEGQKRVRIDVWINAKGKYFNTEGLEKVADLKTKVTFFITDRPKSDRGLTKSCYINDFGQLCWAVGDAEPTESWYLAQGSRVCIDGEDLLTTFIKNWVNAKKTDTVSVNVKNLLNGNFKELTDLVTPFAETPVKVMLTVTKSKKDGKYYQTVYNKFSARWNITSIVTWQKHITGDKSNIPVKASEGKWSYKLEEFVPSSSNLTPDALPKQSPEMDKEADVWVK